MVSNRLGQWKYHGQEVKVRQVTERLGQDTPSVFAEVSAKPNGETSVVKMCPDSGATMSVCSKEMVKYLNLELDTTRSVKLRDVQGGHMQCLGVAIVGPWPLPSILLQVAQTPQVLGAIPNGKVNTLM